MKRYAINIVSKNEEKLENEKCLICSTSLSKRDKAAKVYSRKSKEESFLCIGCSDKWYGTKYNVESIIDNYIASGNIDEMIAKLNEYHKFTIFILSILEDKLSYSGTDVDSNMLDIVYQSNVFSNFILNNQKEYPNLIKDIEFIHSMNK